MSTAVSGTIIVFMCVIFLCHGFVATHDCSHFAVGYGIGTALLQELAKVACEEECARLQLEVLDRNTRAAKLYERIGCKIMREWLPVRMSQPELGTFAAGKGFPDNARNKL
jgi:GNAT superfamily N-acetyltransferase